MRPKFSLRTRRAVPRYWNGRSLAWARAAKHENECEGIPVKIDGSCKVGGNSDAEDGVSESRYQIKSAPSSAAPNGSINNHW